MFYGSKYNMYFMELLRELEYISENCISKLFAWTCANQTSNLLRIFHLNYPRPSLVSGSFPWRLLTDSPACSTWRQVLEPCCCVWGWSSQTEGNIQQRLSLHSTVEDRSIWAKAFTWLLNCSNPALKLYDTTVTCRTFDIKEGEIEGLIHVPPNLEIYRFWPVYKHHS